MPVPIIEECEHALSSAFSARTRILDVIQGILDYADADRDANPAGRTAAPRAVPCRSRWPVDQFRRSVRGRYRFLVMAVW